MRAQARRTASSCAASARRTRGMRAHSRDRPRSRRSRRRRLGARPYSRSARARPPERDDRRTRPEALSLPGAVTLVQDLYSCRQLLSQPRQRGAALVDLLLVQGLSRELRAQLRLVLGEHYSLDLELYFVLDRR